METQDLLKENIAATLARVLPEAKIITTLKEANSDFPALMQIAVPKSFELKELDFEKLLPNPRRTKAAAQFTDAASFLAYINTHADEGTTVWCNFNPQTFALKFTAVLDEHSTTTPGWRQHTATFAPDMSAEWKAWIAKNGQSFAQVPFAEWLEEHAEDITSAEGFPTSLQMLGMATEFVANEERVLKSSAKLQSGGVRLTYVADPDAGTTESMEMFKQFALGIPVFQGGAAWRITARLKYALGQGKVNFRYELVRADRVHESAAKDLITQITEQLGDVPLLMGSIGS
ncbi:YfdQ family protein [Paucibacter sp. DJ1R-11]|uniref:YfdQ family protein n=1 Tax=Paucibacter sp. DJ1R-11 TaxID=2893556 RepID=UPI0021E4ABFA|nr:YfdQ family protein [Paucibacter sp. DJ1R-11]MCV2365560.1 YfdQ family protein [Paucibacter sp. DJ1R-11]